MNTYLLEIGLEEMPAQMILPAVEQLKSLAQKTCEKQRLNFNDLKTYSSPRRLSIELSGLPDKENDRKVELKGPPLSVAKDDHNNWTQAALGFARKNNVSLKNLETKTIEGKDYLFVQQRELGQHVPELLQESAKQWISQLNFPKNMRWGSYKTRYIRPIRWVVSLWNSKVVPIKLEMLVSGNQTRGHRFLSNGYSKIKHASDYEQHLYDLKVIADFEKRRQAIVTQVRKLEKKHDCHVELDEKLLNEVTNLVEWPTVLIGDFENEFLELPDEVLTTSMEVHQRYFPVFSSKKKKNSGEKKLLSNFVTVRNGDNKSLETVRRGNSKVLRARLSDARFFYHEDQKNTLYEFSKKAEKVVFFQSRGSQHQRVQRINQLSTFISEKLNLSSTQKKHVQRIAELSKFDLETKMVYEFPELQGVMGQNYALLKKEKDVVCNGIREHYYPRNAKDSLPKNSETVPVAIGDKLDLITTAFSLGMIPSGATDPYALRRNAQGITQLILGLRLSLDLTELTEAAIRILDEQQPLDLDCAKLQQELLEFLLQRQRWFFQEQGIRYDLIDAVVQSPADVFRLPLTSPVARPLPHHLPIEQLELAEYLSAHLETEMFKRSVEAIVRAENISKKYPDKIAKKIDESQLGISQEKNFLKALQPILNADQNSRLSPADYLKQLHQIEPIVTSFFEDVMVMDENPVKCGNRLWLCHKLASWSARHLNLKAIVFS
ncbi:MAG: glycine--tRNA ligase subunit beta [SAR324 cluster bacterium]|nr:glycine--tRNA ligase subunit beta [SAR324 cluster bacterium]